MRTRLMYLLPLWMLSSCTHYFYAPNSQNAPMMREKNEARVMIGAISADEIDGFETQLAYSPVNHLGLMFNYANAKGGNDFSQGNGHQVEAGAGYYLPMDAKTTFECYAGFGGGKIFNQYDSNESYHLNFKKFFIQPGIGYNSDYFDAIFSLRLAYLSIQSDDIVNSQYNPHSELNEVASTPHSFLVEPAVTLRGGWKFIKVQTQFGGSFNQSNPDFPQEQNYFSIGLYSSFTPRWLEGKKARPGGRMR